jgi:hypothetical protein
MVLEYDEIVSIEEMGEGEIFDLEVPETNCYFANDILHHNSGKDRTIAKLALYIVYKLLCLKNPHKYLREKYNASIGDDDNIDIANMSINARQAQNVFFKKFKSLLKKCTNPNTGRNWFAERGVDLRDGYDVQNTEVRFPYNITCHSLNSETNTGEGLNIFWAIIDEFGSFPAQKAFELLDAIQDSVISRFPEVGKVCIMSYKYYENDPMHVLYEKGKNEERIFSSRHSTWDVNIQRPKKDFAAKYRKNPEKSKMTYECLGGSTEGGYVSKKYMLNYMFDPKYENPVKGDLLSVDGALLGNLQFKPWFRGSEGRLYAIHFDLGTGNVQKKNDCVGFAMSHVDKMYPRFDEKLKKDLFKEGIMVEMTSDEVARKGVVTDLSLQILAGKGGEVQLSDLRKFVVRLKTQLNFNIIFVTYDGWQSKDSIQIMNQQGIYADEFSVDKSNDAYESWKELMYQQLWKCHPQDIANREAKELVINEKGKVDHPEKSWERMITENNDHGSKDLIDAIVASGKKAYESFNLEPDIYFG